MLWFNGSVKDAVDKVKASGVFLLVFVQGNDKLSKKYEAYLNERAIFKLNDYVAIKIPHDSLALQQFKQIYISVPIPSVFLIQNNGKILNVVSSSDTSEIHSAIADAVNNQKLKEEFKKKIHPNNESSANSINKKKEETSPELSHVKNIGHKLFNVSEEELKVRLKEIRAFPKFLLMDSPTSCDHPRDSIIHTKPQSARIQFRLPNNSMPSWEFPELATLADVRAYLMEKMKLSPNFKLLRTYPRYTFTLQDEHKTLDALFLTPNATLIVVPYEDKTVQAKVNELIHQNLFTTMLNMLLQPLYGLFGFFKKHILRHQPAQRVPERFSRVRSFEKTVNKTTFTSRSNIHGLKFEEDTDTDTEHPDNGNSTQQRFQ